MGFTNKPTLAEGEPEAVPVAWGLVAGALCPAREHVMSQAHKFPMTNRLVMFLLPVPLSRVVVRFVIRHYTVGQTSNELAEKAVRRIGCFFIVRSVASG